MADKIVVMRDGRVEQVGSPLDLYDAPHNTFVATFIGSPSMNLFECRVEGGAVALSDGTRLPCASMPALADGQKVLYGVRPEDFTLADTGVPATVKVTEPTGAETMVVVSVLGTDAVAVFRERHALRPGDRVHLMPAADRVHLFDATSGARLAEAMRDAA